MFNRLIYWIAIGVVIYILLTGRSEQQAQSPEQGGGMQQAIERLVKPVMKGEVPVEAIGQQEAPIIEPYDITDTKQGAGNVALCGSEVAVNYKITFKNKVDSNATPMRFMLGKRSVLPGIEQTVRGMRAGGTRTANLPPALAYNNAALAKSPYSPLTTIPIQVELLSASPQANFPNTSLQVFDQQAGKGPKAICGSAVTFVYSIRTVEGKQLAKADAPINVLLGQGSLPFGMEEALVGIQKDGTRTAILFPDVMRRFGTGNAVKLENEDDYPDAALMVELKALSVQ